jgi:hypothetical protein
VEDVVTPVTFKLDFAVNWLSTTTELLNVAIPTVSRVLVILTLSNYRSSFSNSNSVWRSINSNWSSSYS